MSGSQELESALAQFCAEDQGKRAADHEQNQARRAVLNADHLVIVVNTEIASPGGLAFRRSVMQ